MRYLHFVVVVLVCCTLSVVHCVASGGGTEKSAVAEGVVTASSSQNSGDVASTEPPSTGGASLPVHSGILKLSISDLIKLVRERNERIGYQQLQWDISREGVKNAKSIFEPEFVATYQHEKNFSENTIEEALARTGGALNLPTAEYDERNNDYQVAFEGLVPTGAQLRLGYTVNDITNSLTDVQQYRSVLGGSIVQPLLKNAGIKTTMANIRVAEADSDIALQGYRQELLQVTANAAAAYWDLRLSQEKSKVREESVRIAAEILKDNRERVKTGKMAETEVLEAEAGLAARESLLIGAAQDVASAINNVRTFISSSAAQENLKVEAADPLSTEWMSPRFEHSVAKALELRPEYLSSLRKTEREGIRIAYAKNQRWPQLDLKGSYGLNGLDLTPGESWSKVTDADHESWSVGLEFRIPIGGGKKTLSELDAAKRRKKQALLEVKATETALANAVDTSIKYVYSAQKQARNYSRAVDLNARLLEVELARFNAGKSNSRTVLDREEDLNTAREAYLESLLLYRKAVVSLEMAEGTLLSRYGLDIVIEKN